MAKTSKNRRERRRRTENTMRFQRDRGEGFMSGASTSIGHIYNRKDKWGGRDETVAAKVAEVRVWGGVHLHRSTGRNQLKKDEETEQNVGLLPSRFVNENQQLEKGRNKKLKRELNYGPWGLDAEQIKKRDSSGGERVRGEPIHSSLKSNCLQLVIRAERINNPKPRWVEFVYFNF